MSTGKITLATLTEATEQEVFDQIARHLLLQNRRSLSEGGSCAYRSPEGLACAAGCLIAEEEYRRDRMEGKSWRTLIFDGIVPPHRVSLIMSLQDLHDNAPPDNWPAKLAEVAVQFKLKQDAIQTAMRERGKL